MLDIINNYAMAVCNVNWYTITVSLLVLQYLYIHKMVVWNSHTILWLDQTEASSSVQMIEVCHILIVSYRIG
jgi:hypothetical protein